ncbi:MAG: thioredoxin family protein [Saprospiraceae bacterium]
MRITFASILLSASLVFGLTACHDHDRADASRKGMTTEEGKPKAIAVSLKEAGLSIGDKAPDFKLENVDGTYYSLADIKDANGAPPKGYIVTFTCNTCPFAQKYEDRLIALHKKMSPLGYPLIAIQPNDGTIQPGDNMQAMRQRAKTKGFPYVYLLDANQEVYPQYGAGRTPEVYLLDSDLILQYHGAVDDNAQNPDDVSINYVENAIEALENGEIPSPLEVKAIGCMIKAKKS